MKISLSWLNDYIKTNSSVQTLAERMTDLGLECTYESSGLSFTNVVLGNVITCEPHPDSDHLSVCEVDTGDDENWQIVCGAPNVKAGIKVPVAKVGATLDNGSFKIKKAKLRGVPSKGMICSGKELELSDDHDGILIIESNLPLGTPIEEVLDTKQETIFELDLTPNRGDCFSHRGVAREVATVENSPFKLRHTKISEVDEKLEDSVTLNNIDEDASPRYATRVIRNVKVRPSPEWLRARLASIGQKSINNIVDAANFVLMDTGHPMHTFDLDKISTKEINVRFANDGEKFTTLDNVERELKDFHLVICDGNTPIALGGIMGGANSEIDDSTTDILIESAYFKPTVIRKGAKRLDLSTEASKRFERDTDIESVIPALNQLSALIQEVAGGDVLSGVIDRYPTKKEAQIIEFSIENCNSFLGSSFSLSEAKEIFEKLSITVDEKDNGLQCTIPSFRNDLEREVDLFEEVARVVGYNNIPSSMNFTGAFDAFTEDERSLDDELRKFVSVSGFNEHYSNSLNNSDEITHFSDCDSVLLANPLSQEMAYLRNSLMPGLLKSISYNEKRQCAYFKLFEIGAVHQKDEQSETKTAESFQLGLAWYGKSQLHWRKRVELDLFEAKGDLAQIFSNLKLTKIRYELVEKSGFDLCLQILNRKTEIGFIGIPTKKMCKRYDIRGNIFVAQLNIDILKSAIDSLKNEFVVPNPYPFINRDIAIQVESNVTAEAILRTIKSRGGELLKDISLFDLYTGKELGEHQKSLAFSLTFQSPKKTLQDSDVDPVMEKIASQLTKQHNAVQR
ncbi:MAG: phenylalanine--tRNA ligase subunit beta [Candidatus Marinimicrobia bacterium]|nr:phenylalanine--tRNA ligase subunit beta [Candidatus Neomarinimicrobiota bacterium]